jgi:hypothetical protein
MEGIGGMFSGENSFILAKVVFLEKRKSIICQIKVILNIQKPIAT